MLIYDELAAEKPITWTFQLHSLKPITQLGNAWFKGANAHAIGSARLFCAAPVTGSVTDKFLGMPVDEKNKRGGNNPPNWHVTITTKDALPATRFLTVIEVIPTTDCNGKLVEPIAEGTGRIQLARWRFHRQRRTRCRQAVLPRGSLIKARPAARYRPGDERDLTRRPAASGDICR